MVFDHLRSGTFSTIGALFGNLPGRLWSLFCTLSGLLVIALVCAVLIKEHGGTMRPAVVIDGPPQNEAFEYRNGRGRLPTLRVALGSKFHFHLPWHIQEGGCERVITRTFSRGEPGWDAYSLTQQMIGKPHPVGKPALDYIERDLPQGIDPGLWFYRAVGEVRNCPIPRNPEPTVYAEFYIDVVDPDGPISIEDGVPVLAKKVVPVGGPLQYRESFTRTADVPSEILFTFTEVEGGRDIVLERRPGAYSAAGEYRDVDVTVPLPAAVHPGKWRLRKTVISTRPGGRTRADPMFEIEFEVAG